MDPRISQAETNLLTLKENTYPGRGIIVGMDETGEYLIQVYWIMGRSENSRNRIFVIEEDGLVKTAPFDSTKIEDPSLIIYTAMAQKDDYYAVSNGHQTLDILGGGNLADSLAKWTYEPDAPNYTPRISALIKPDILAQQYAQISIIRKSKFSNEAIRIFYKFALSPGLGYCVTTYTGDGNPLPSFTGEPYLLPLVGNIQNVSQKIWETLNEDNKISLAVKFIKINENKILITKRNKHEGD